MPGPMRRRFYPPPEPYEPFDPRSILPRVKKPPAPIRMNRELQRRATMTLAGRSALAKRIASSAAGPVGIGYTIAEMTGITTPFSRPSYENVIDLRKRKFVAAPVMQGITKKPALTSSLNPLSTSAGSMAYGGGTRALGRPAKLGVMRKRRGRRSRRAPRKRTFAKRVKKVLNNTFERKFVTCPVPSFIPTDSPQTQANADARIADALSENFIPAEKIPVDFGTVGAPNIVNVGANGRYVFSRNFPAMGYINLLRLEHFPAHSSSSSNGYFRGRNVEFTGYTVEGSLEISPQALTQGFVRIHVLTTNQDKMPQVPGTDNRPGQKILYGTNLASNRAGYANIRVSDTTNVLEAGQDDLVLFDNNNGNRNVDRPFLRSGWFNHGYRLNKGFSIKTSVTLDGRLLTSAANLSTQTLPFKFFVPTKYMFTNLDNTGSASAVAFQFMEKVGHLSLLIEQCMLNYDDSADFPLAQNAGNLFSVNINPLRFHYRDRD